MISSFFRNNLLLLFFLVSGYGLAQKQDRIWLFADSAGIDFNDLNNPISIRSNITNPCLSSFASIADTAGQLLFYTAGVNGSLTSQRIFDKFGNLMDNGDSLIGYSWVGQGSMILPMPGDRNKYYLFTGVRTGSMGNQIYYQIIDMSTNGGLGKVISKNNLLLSDYVNEKMNATRHANGRDWWLVLMSTNTDQLYHKFLVEQDSIIGPMDQLIGSGDNRNKAFGQMIFAQDGQRLVVTSSNSSIDIFDFDRCSGDLYNYIKAGEDSFSLPNRYFGCSISANCNILYTSCILPDYQNVYQYDLTSSDIRASKQTIISYPDTGQQRLLELGQHLLGPDNRIYIVRGNGFTGTNSNTFFTHHLDVIVDPDQVGSNCNYESAYFDLGNGRGVEGLPTMINYNLGPVLGSICDSLGLGINEPFKNKSLEVFPNPFSSFVAVHSIYRLEGRIIISNEVGAIAFEKQVHQNETLDLSFLNAGIYLFKFISEEGITEKKLVKME